MRKTAIITILFSAMLSTVMARPVMPGTAQKAAQYFWQNTLHGKGELKATGWAYNEAYLFCGTEGGFVILSADDCARPIIGYSTTETIDPQQLPPQLAERMAAYCERIAEGIAQRATATKEDAQEWHMLTNGEMMLTNDEDDRVAPLLETHWHQDGSYSLLCPAGTVTGCAATAQSQFMRYWQYPAFGHGKESYSLPAYGTLSADFAHTLYDWANMPEQVFSYSPQEEQTAVSTLLYHVGVSLHTSYNSPSNGGSAAVGLTGFEGVPSIDNSLKDFFYYSRQMRVIMRTDTGWSDEAWDDSLATELRLRHPIVYCGVAPEGGHGFVCDGFEHSGSRLYFHFNFGWSGSGDGYYTTNDICPNVSPTGQVGSAYHFNQSNQALLGAVPVSDIHLSDTLVNYERGGGAIRVLFSSDYYSTEPWSVSSDQPWLTIDTTGAGRAGWVTLQASENTLGNERQATVTFTQNGKSVSLTAMQTYYTEEDYCPLKVKMQSTGNGGWEGGAYLSFESSTGFVYATTTLTSGRESTETVQVPPSGLNVVFHSGGGTDRYINYFVYNQYDEELVAVEYAYRYGGTHWVAFPCAHVGVGEATEAEVTVWPNPTCDRLHVEGMNLSTISLYDMQGRLIGTYDSGLVDLSAWPQGVYLLRVTTPKGVSTKRITKQ